jgi:hypothetical protein
MDYADYARAPDGTPTAHTHAPERRGKYKRAEKRVSLLHAPHVVCVGR